MILEFLYRDTGRFIELSKKLFNYLEITFNAVVMDFILPYLK